MRFPSDVMNFKRDHPHNYWVRVLCLAFCLVFAMLWFVGDASGDAPVGDVVDNELFGESFEALVNNWQPGSPGVRQTNGTLWHFGTNVNTYGVDHEIIASYSSDNGTSWASFVLMDNSYPGFEIGGYPWKVTDGVGLSNNSIVISLVLQRFGTAAKAEVWLMCHWNNSDLGQWELIDVYTNAGQNVDKDPTIAVNG